MSELASSWVAVEISEERERPSLSKREEERRRTWWWVEGGREGGELERE